MKVLITGALGHLGGSLIGLAPANWQIEPFQRGSQLSTPHEYDLVVHCAAVHPRAATRPTLEAYLTSNVGLVQKIAEGTMAKSCRLIFISTSYLNAPALLGPAHNDFSLYSVSKAMAEVYLKTVAPSFHGVYVLRLPVLLSSGPQENSFLQATWQAISASEPVALYNAEAPFPVTDAEEVMALIHCLAQKGPQGFHVLPGGACDTLRLEEIVELFREGFAAKADPLRMIARQGVTLPTNPLLAEIGFAASTSFEIISRFMRKEIGTNNVTKQLAS